MKTKVNMYDKDETDLRLHVICLQLFEIWCDPEVLHHIRYWLKILLSHEAGLDEKTKIFCYTICTVIFVLTGSVYVTV